MGLLTQLGLLLWKNFILRKRQKIRLVIELLWPLFLFFILVWVRSTNKPVYKGQCHYPNKAMPSAGVLPWFQGMMCNINNPCVSHPTAGETPGQVNNFNSSIIAGLLIELQTLVVNRSILTKAQRLSEDLDRWASILEKSDPANGQPIAPRSILRDDEKFTTYLRGNLSVPASVVDGLMSSQIRVNQAMGLGTSSPASLKAALCDGTSLDRYVLFPSPADKQAFQNVSCSLSPQQLAGARRAFLDSLDSRKVFAAIPQSLALDPRETFILLSKTSADAIPVIIEIAALQRSEVLKAASELNFREDMFGSINTLLCGPQPDSNSTNSTASFKGVGGRQNGTSGNDTFAGTGNRNSSEFCQTLVETLESTPGLRVVWSTFRPLLQGKVLYTPDTPATRLMVKQANSTFNALAMLKELADSWDVLGPRLWNFLQDGRQVNALRTLLASPLFAAALNQQLTGSRWSAEQLANFLYNGPPEERPTGMPPTDWRDVFNATSQVVELLKQFIGCLDLNKFEAVPSERQLVTKAQELLKDDKYWAGIVFQDLLNNASSPPPHVKYKIRMDIDEVERSSKIKERSWSPGARDNPFNDLRYVWGGFAYLQDMMDHGIVRSQTPGAQPLGVFVQQMPYPCYVNDAFVQSIGGILPMFLVLSFMYSICMVIKGLVLEKELRLKEVMRAVGVRNGALWLAWFAENLAVLAVPCLLMSVLLKLDCPHESLSNCGN